MKTGVMVMVMGMVMGMVMRATGAMASCPGTANRINHFILLGSSCTQVTDIPRNTTHVFIKDTVISVVNQTAFRGLKELFSVSISENTDLRKIDAFAFADFPKLTEISITNSKHLTTIAHYAFMNLPKLKHLRIINTGLRVLPDFTQIHSSALVLLELQDNIHIERIPSNALRGLCSDEIQEVRLIMNGLTEVESHAFNGTKMNKLSLWGNARLSRIHGNAFMGAVGPEALDISGTAVSSLPESVLPGLRDLVAMSVGTLKELPPLQLFTQLHQANLTYPSHCCAFQNARMNRSTRIEAQQICSHPDFQKEEPQYFKAHCSNSTAILCGPLPDEFNPCENIMGSPALRVLIWLISILTLLGNVVVLLVLLGSRTKLTVPRFLMCHLSFADLCMAVYLLIIATVDMKTREKYYNHAIDWQTGPGCSAAGFFTVFASELSVFTLTTITLERWHTITHALRLDRKLRLRHACVVMAAGWVFSFVAAVLPTAGVSSYGKVSICLPMDVESAQAQVYVVSLLTLNVLAFLCVCYCYLRIYLTVRNPSSAPARADTRVAQRMAVLIFTNFVCMAPISFFALSAALKYPLITVSHSKVLLVLFYPINSCANPFLYAFFTRNFRRDFYLLAARFGLCTTRAQIYRTETSSVQQPAWIPTPKTRHGMVCMLLYRRS